MTDAPTPARLVVTVRLTAEGLVIVALARSEDARDRWVEKTGYHPNRPGLFLDPAFRS